MYRNYVAIYTYENIDYFYLIATHLFFKFDTWKLETWSIFNSIELLHRDFLLSPSLPIAELPSSMAQITATTPAVRDSLKTQV